MEESNNGERNIEIRLDSNSEKRRGEITIRGGPGWLYLGQDWFPGGTITLAGNTGWDCSAINDLEKLAV